jgi:hypothetical protein
LGDQSEFRYGEGERGRNETFLNILNETKSEQNVNPWNIMLKKFVIV